MKKNNVLIFLLFVFGTSILPAFPQNFAGTVIDYVPAPGQHINIENIGSPKAAQKMVESTGSLVSLGSFGGYIILKFNEACENHPENPYGIDFTVFGNAFSGSSEPGVVWVMKDSNKNGIPDDTWYEIAGSNHFFSGTVRDYEVTYLKTATRDVIWKDNHGKTGHISANEFNLQEYYPSPEYFASYPKDSVSFTGTLLNSEFITSSGEIQLTAPTFGYADSHPQIKDVDLWLPDNPYTKEIEGAGGDPVDISWTIDRSGNYVDLDSIHFVKIVSGSFKIAGWLGEISTDVAWVQDVNPQPQATGKESLLIYRHHPSKIILGDSLKLNALYFDRGRFTNDQVFFQSANEEIATVDSSGLLITHSTGETQITFTAREETEFTSIKVVVPESVRFLTDFSAIYPGDTLEINSEVYDNYSEGINLRPQISSSNSSTVRIFTIEDKTFLVALQPGEFILTASIDKFHFEKSIAVKVRSYQSKINVLLSIKTEDENLLPLQQVEIGLADLNAAVENRNYDYSNLNNITLFHALAEGLKKAEVPFKFREDEAEGSLYLYMVENDGLFTYGWGGKTSPAANARAWIARINGKQYLKGFENILLSDKDTVFLYHVQNILLDWNFTRLLSNKYSVAPGENLEILFEQSTCRFDNGEITEFDFIPVVNAPVSGGNTWYTNGEGRIRIIPENNFPLIISSGNDAVRIIEDINVSADTPAYNFMLYPNPVGNRLFVSAINLGSYPDETYRIALYDPAGVICIEKESPSIPVGLDLSSLTPGVYHLRIAKGSKLEIHKIIKR